MNPFHSAVLLTLSLFGPVMVTALVIWFAAEKTYRKRHPDNLVSVYRKKIVELLKHSHA